MYKVAERWKEPFNIDFLKLLGGIAESIGVFGMRLPITSNKYSYHWNYQYLMVCLAEKLQCLYLQKAVVMQSFSFPGTLRGIFLALRVSGLLFARYFSTKPLIVCRHKALQLFGFFLESPQICCLLVLQPFVIKRRKENLTDLIVICITYEIFLIESRGDSD